jgi:GT2 family glycosyltransferase
MNKVEISVIIITKNDVNVQETLEALKHIRYPAPTEVIVVDASCPSDHLTHIRERYPEVQWVSFDSSTCMKATFPEQRNKGVQHSRGKYIVYLDCGCTPAFDWLEQMYHSLQIPKVVVASRIIGKGRSSVFEIDERFLHAPLVERLETGGAGLGFSRELYDLVGGFDERFSHAEDVDFSWMARHLGYHIYLNTSAIVVHDWEGWGKEVRRYFKYGASRAKLYKKHTWLWWQLFSSDSDVLAYPLFIIGLPLTFFFPWYPLILLIPFVKNIRRMPFLVVTKDLIFGLGVIFGAFRSGFAV